MLFGKINEKKLTKEEQMWEKEKSKIERKQKLEADKKSTLQKQKRKISTTKLLIAFLFINCTLIELFTGWAIIQSIQLAAIMAISPDFSPLIALIGAIVSEVMGFAIYAIKSTKENTKNGIVFETTMAHIDDNNADG